jgi:exosortase
MTGQPGSYGRIAAALLLGAVVLWADWPAVQVLLQRWRHDPQYSHGYIVPLFSLFLLWRTRIDWRAVSFAPNGWGVAFLAAAALWLAGSYLYFPYVIPLALLPAVAGIALLYGGRPLLRQCFDFRGEPLAPNWWGVVFLGAAAVLRLAGSYVYFPYFTDLSLIPAAAGIALLCGGWPMLRQCAAAILFLGFMLPLPYGLQVALAGRLQGVATAASVYVLELAGFPVIAQGNQIFLRHDQPLFVQEACSGLSMLLTFLALCTGAAILVRRPLLDKVIVLLSAVPIAVVVNVLRISATGILIRTAGERAGMALYHDFAGLLMMPVAVLLIVLELFVLGRLLVPAASVESRPLPLHMEASGAAVPRPDDTRVQPAQPEPALPPG